MQRGQALQANADKNLSGHPFSPAVLTHHNLAIARAALLAAGKMKRLIRHFKIGNASNYSRFYRRSKYEKRNAKFAGHDKKPIRLLQLIYEKWMTVNVRGGVAGARALSLICLSLSSPNSRDGSRQSSRRLWSDCAQR